MATLPKECCTLPPIESVYVQTGIETSLQSNGTTLNIYETGNLSSSKVLICVYDIFGVHPNTKQVCDRLGSTGEFHVVMPDFFRGSPWSKDNFPPADFKEIFDWVAEVGNWEKSVKKDVQTVIEHYKKAGGGTKFGMFGFCWGGKVSIQAGGDPDVAKEIKGVALIHSGFNEEADAQKVQVPTFFLPSQNEPDLLPFYNIVKNRLGEDSAQHHRFDDMIHGFAAARGDFNDPNTRARVDQLIQMVNTFFQKHLSK